MHQLKMTTPPESRFEGLPSGKGATAPAITISGHALKRCQSRGISLSMIESIVLCADREVPVGRGCTALSLTKAAARAHGALAEKLSGIVAVMSDDGTLVTVLHAYGRRGRRYQTTRGSIN
jgi:hypothetical protein